MSTAVALAYDAPSNVIVHSDLLGDLEVSEDQILEFPAGILGFPECRSFVLLPAQREGFYWLQSLDHSTLAFVLVDPFVYFPGYGVELSELDGKELRAEEDTDVAILAIVTLPASRDQPPTANLQGPLALNLRARRGKQLALDDSDQFGLRCPIPIT